MAKALLALLIASALSLCVIGAEREFDFWTFSLRWAPTVCRRTTECCSSNACCRASAPDNFVIQALWPDYDDGTYPTFCNCTARFDYQQIASLIPALERDFPFLSCEYFDVCNDDKTKTEWAYLWEKHGTCGYPVIKDQYSYFLKALTLYRMHDPSNAIVPDFPPSNDVDYDFYGLVATIRSAVGARPWILCDEGNVKSVQLCFTKDFKPRDCPNILACPGRVRLPTYGPLGKGTKNGIAQVTG